MTIIKKRIGDNKKNWDSKIKYALWADSITKKTPLEKAHLRADSLLGWSLRNGSYFANSLEDPSLQDIEQFSSNQDVVQNRINQLIEAR
jgi:hypothetical protein